MSARGIAFSRGDGYHSSVNTGYVLCAGRSDQSDCARSSLYFRAVSSNEVIVSWRLAQEVTTDSMHAASDIVTESLNAVLAHGATNSDTSLWLTCNVLFTQQDRPPGRLCGFRSLAILSVCLSMVRRCVRRWIRADTTPGGTPVGPYKTVRFARSMAVGRNKTVT